MRHVFMAPRKISETGEYVVRCFTLSEIGEITRYPDGDYYTEDKDDAIDTFNAMLQREYARVTAQ